VVAVEELAFCGGKHNRLTVYAEEENNAIAIATSVKMDGSVLDICSATCIVHASTLLSSEPGSHSKGAAEVAIQVFPGLAICSGGVLRTEIQIPSPHARALVAITDGDR
jgi:hypothetical protein